MKIGVLALQGAFIEHQHVLEKLGVETVQVRLPEHLAGLDGLIIPGGESTTISKLATAFGLMQPLREFAQQHAVWGTCAGAIFLSRDVGRDQPVLGLMDITVRRNAFGRQVDSFETLLDVPALGRVDAANRPFPAVFIRAPLIEKVNGTAEVLAALPEGGIVAVQQGRWLATSFHPELSDDDRFHRYFLELAR
ncbi:MAG: pyridoxal 5'-phosphate synthase glutaminase subunit PdxT [Chloroflexota bacterium]